MDETTRKFVEAHRHDDVKRLALQAARYPGVCLPEALTQIAGWQMAVEKLPTWAACEGVLFPPRLSMEQCSSEATARYKATLLSGYSLTDLTGGLGVDFQQLALHFVEATYVERNEALCTLARHNLPLLSLPHAQVVNAEATDYLQRMPRQSALFLDPARRDGQGRKTVALADCEPDVTALEAQLLEKAERVLVKCSPMLDATEACRRLKQVREVHVVAVRNECKELLLLLAAGSEAPIFHCVNVEGGQPQTFSFTQAQEAACPCDYTHRVEGYLYEPHAALLKAGCVRLPAQRFGLKKLHPNSQLYTSDEQHADFPGRVFRVLSYGGFGKSELRQQLQGLRQANLTVRNFPQTVEVLRKKLALAEGGADYLFATTLNDGRHVLIRCQKG